MSEAHWGDEDLVDSCSDLYEGSREGQTAVTDYCRDIDHPHWGFCEDCECEAPYVHRGEEKKCLICSFGNIKGGI